MKETISRRSPATGCWVAKSWMHWFSMSQRLRLISGVVGDDALGLGLVDVLQRQDRAVDGGDDHLAHAHQLLLQPAQHVLKMFSGHVSPPAFSRNGR